jgi:hypothetical protein
MSDDHFKRTENYNYTMTLIREQLRYDNCGMLDTDQSLAIDIYNTKSYDLSIDKISKGRSIWKPDESDELEISYNKKSIHDLKKFNLYNSDCPLSKNQLHQQNYIHFQNLMKKILKEFQNFAFTQDKKFNCLMSYTSKNIEVNKRILNALIKSMKILVKMTKDELKNIK